MSRERLRAVRERDVRTFLIATTIVFGAHGTRMAAAQTPTTRPSQALPNEVGAVVEAPLAVVMPPLPPMEEPEVSAFGLGGSSGGGPQFPGCILPHQYVVSIDTTAKQFAKLQHRQEVQLDEERTARDFTRRRLLPMPSMHHSWKRAVRQRWRRW